MRRESSTVVVLAGEVTGGLLDALSRSANVSVARAGAGQPADREPAAARPGWEVGAQALREAARRQSTYVVVPDDPLADVAAEWRAMWDGLGGAGGFEACAAEVLDALGSLQHAPWWPPLDELLDTVRRFYAGSLAESQPAPPSRSMSPASAGSVLPTSAPASVDAER
jgi:hypothetical protein